MKNLNGYIFSLTTAGVLLLFTACALGLATFIENRYGVAVARATIYHAWWLQMILVLLSVNLTVNIFRYKMYRRAKLTMGVFHFALILIVLGAGVTHYFGHEGVMHIREGERSDIITSSENKFNLIAQYQGEAYKISTKFDAHSNTGGLTNHTIVIGDKKIDLKVLSFFTGAQRSIEPVDEGEPIIEVVYSMLGKMESALLRRGETITPNGVTVGFETDSDITLLFQNDTLKLFSKTDTIRSLDMRGQDALQYSPGISFACAGKIVYRTQNTAIVIKQFLPSAQVIALPGNDTNTGEEGGNFQLSNNKNFKKITVWNSASHKMSHSVVSFDGVNFRIWMGPQETKLPFSLQLNDFVLKRYPGSNSPSSYESLITLSDSVLGINKDVKIFMNNVLEHRGYRFYQSSYDKDEKGTILSVNNDPVGTLFTYSGYFFLFLGIILSIFNPGSHFYGLMKRAATRSTFILIFIIPGALPSNAAESSVISSTVASEFAKVWVQGHDGRIKPFSTLAYEVVMKVSRCESLLGQVPEQVILGMITHSQEWQDVPMIAISDDQIESLLGIKGKASFRDFFDQSGNYKIDKEVEAAYQKNPAERTHFDNGVIKVDERLNVTYQVYQGGLFRFFPAASPTDQAWYSAEDQMPGMLGADSIFVTTFFPELLNALKGDNTTKALQLISGVNRYQAEYGASLIPGKRKQQLEILYNHINIFKNLSGFYVLLGFVLLGFFFYSLFTGKALQKNAVKYLVIGLFSGFLAHSAGLIVRGYVSGHMPWSNGYESMIYIAWAGMLAGLIFARHNPMVLAAAAILSGLTLFVAQMSWLNPEITNLVPVLKSYWLTIHVAIITASYGFIGVSAILGVINLLMAALLTKDNQLRIKRSILQLTLINEAAMILGLYFLTIGTFLGAIWANESWGRYWGWDPKETWSLVTILLYSFIVHMRLIPGLKGWFALNVAAVVGLLSVLMTYLGVNYYLSGLHSYGSGEGLRFPVAVVVIFVFLGMISVVARQKEKRFGSIEEPEPDVSE